MALDRSSMSKEQLLGLETEERAFKALEALGRAKRFEVTHSTPEQDFYEGWDVKVVLGGITYRIDLTTSGEQFEKKTASERVQRRRVIVAKLDPEWSDYQICLMTFKQLFKSLSYKEKLTLLRKLGLT